MIFDWFKSIEIYIFDGDCIFFSKCRDYVLVLGLHDGESQWELLTGHWTKWIERAKVLYVAGRTEAASKIRALFDSSLSILFYTIFCSYFYLILLFIYIFFFLLLLLVFFFLARFATVILLPNFPFIHFRMRLLCSASGRSKLSTSKIGQHSPSLSFYTSRSNGRSQSEGDDKIAFTSSAMRKRLPIVNFMANYLSNGWFEMEKSSWMFPMLKCRIWKSFIQVRYDEYSPRDYRVDDFLNQHGRLERLDTSRASRKQDAIVGASQNKKRKSFDLFIFIGPIFLSKCQEEL